MARRTKRGGGCLRAFLIWLALMGMLIVTAVVIIYLGLPQKWIREWGEKHNPIPFQTNSIREEEVAKKYFYEMLNEEERVTYQEILQGIREYNTEIYLRETNADVIQKVVSYIMYDTPEIFWYDGSSTITSYEEGLFSEAYAILAVTYSGTPEEIEVQKQEIETVVLECLALAPESDEYEKIKYVYDYIVNTVTYDLEAPNSQNIYSVFVGKSSVCAGYSKAFQYLMERMDIFATYVVGKTNEGREESRLGHAWNLVRCDGEYYYVDVTWGDPLFETGEDEESKIIEGVHYDYMLCTGEELFRTHQLGEGIVMPECTATQNNYYRRNNMYYDAVDEQIFLQVLQSSLAEKSAPVTFKFSDEAVFAEGSARIVDELIEVAARSYMNTQNLSELYYYHQTDETQHKVVIEWGYE